MKEKEKQRGAKIVSEFSGLEFEKWFRGGVDSSSNGGSSISSSSSRSTFSTISSRSSSSRRRSLVIYEREGKTARSENSVRIFRP